MFHRSLHSPLHRFTPSGGGGGGGVAHERSTPAIALGGVGGRWLSVSATLQEHRDSGGAQAGACPLKDFSLTATLIADPSRR